MHDPRLPTVNLDLAIGNDEFEDAKNVAAGLDQLSEVLEKIETNTAETMVRDISH